MQSTALRFADYGKPNDVLQIESLDLPKPKANEAVLKLLAAPINPADLGRIGGSYGDLPQLPATAGLEGVAEVIELGDADNSNLRLGQRVFVPATTGSWQTHAVAPVAELYPAPENLSPEQASMGWINPPTAWKLIHDFAKLQPGDWIAQNAATSAVGRLVIQFARHLGFKTINLASSLDSQAALKDLGADIVALDDRDAAKQVLSETKGEKARLGLNSVGGNSALSLCKLLQDSSPLVTFGAMDGEPARFPTRYLIFNDIKLLGFWLNKWYEKSSSEAIRDLHQEIFTFMENADISVEVAARYQLADWKDALEHSIRRGKSGKVLFTP